MSLSGVYGEADDAASERLIRDAIALGGDHFDSSDMYGWRHNECVVGRALKGLWDRVVLATCRGSRRIWALSVALTAAEVSRISAAVPAGAAAGGMWFVSL